MAPTPNWKYAWRISTEAAFNTASPEGKAEWNIGGNGGGANGWMDMPAIDSDGLQPKQAIVFPAGQSGGRAMNRPTPIPGSYLPELGSLEFPVYPELIDRFFRAIMGTIGRVETAGAAAKSAVAFASLATLDTQPNGTEQLKFVIASSTAASGAAINIIQSAATQETITIGTNAGTVDGTYYSKGAYDGSTNAITFSIAGTVTAGLVTVSGVDYVTNTHTMLEGTPPTLVIEQQGRPEAGSGNSEYFTGVIVPTLVFNYDRNAADGLLMANATLHGRFPVTPTTKTTYQNDVGTYYKPFAAWNASIDLDSVGYDEIVSLQMTLQPNNAMNQVSTGDQQPASETEGMFEVFGQMTLLPENANRWTDYKNVTARDIEIEFLTPHYVVDTTAYRLLFELTNFYIEDFTRVRVNNTMGVQLGFRTKYNASDGPVKVTTRCRLPV